MVECVAVVYQLVPYHDARFSAAARQVDLSVIELHGQNQGMVWSSDVNRQFPTRLLALAKDTPQGELTAKLSEALDRLAPKVVAVQGWASAAALDAILLARRRGAQIIAFSESNVYDHPRRPAKEWLKSRVLRLCDAALVGGRDHLAYLEALGFGHERIALGYNAVDNAHFMRPSGLGSVAVNPLGINPDQPPYFLVASRLAPEKNLVTALAAYAAYRRLARGQPWDLRIIGVGPLDAELRRQSHELGLDGSVHFEGFQGYEVLPGFYHRAGALLHTATQEPWGLVVNEALAAGLPVIVSDRCGSCCELVRDGQNGFVVDPLDIGAIAARMAALANGDVDREAFGRASSAIVAEWGPERFASGFRAAVSIALSRPARPTAVDRVAVRSLAAWM